MNTQMVRIDKNILNGFYSVVCGKYYIHGYKSKNDAVELYKAIKNGTIKVKR